MVPDPAHLAILRDVAAFSKVKRYRGMLPTRLALYQDQTKVEELLDAGFIERINASMACGSEHVLLKLTDAGGEALRRMEVAPPRPGEPPAPGESAPARTPRLNEEQEIILNDVYHYAKIRRFGGMMPESELSAYEARNVNNLFARGFVIRVKADLGSGKKRKGLILSEKGLRYLGSPS